MESLLPRRRDTVPGEIGSAPDGADPPRGADLLLAREDLVGFGRVETAFPLRHDERRNRVADEFVMARASDMNRSTPGISIMPRPTNRALTPF